MGHPEIESTDHFEGIAPVPKRVRLDLRKPGKIIAVPKLLKSNCALHPRSNGPRTLILYCSSRRVAGQARRWPAGSHVPRLRLVFSFCLDEPPRVSMKPGAVQDVEPSGARHMPPVAER